MASSGKWFVPAVVISISILTFGCGGGSSSPSEGISTTVQTAGTPSGFQGMTLGEIRPLTFLGSSATLDFGNPSEGDQYLLVVNNTATSSGDYSIQLASVSAAALTLSQPSLSDNPAGLTLDESEEPPPQEQFHQYLREMENVVSQSGEFHEISPSPLAALSTPPKAGDIEPFRVLSSMNSITTYQEVKGDLKYVSGNLLIYLDQSVEDHVTLTDIQKLANTFEGVALDRERDLFGRESDSNADGHISILMTCVLNRMSTSGGIVTGFFFPGDLYQRSSSNPASNGQEIFYTMVPDPDGRCGTPISTSFTINNILPGVLAHEYQHMTSFNQHVFKNRGTTEESWLNEALSHFAEDLTGYGNENPSRVNLFLAQPARTSLVPPASPTLAERGGSYLFLRYLYEQSDDGDAFLRRLYSSSQTGISNLESAFASPEPSFKRFPEFLNRWSLVLALSGTGITSDPKYNYRERTTNPVTGNFTGVCIRCETQDGRGTVLGGPVMTTVSHYPAASTLKATSTQFYRLNRPAGLIRLSGGANSTLAGALIRLQKS